MTEKQRQNIKNASKKRFENYKFIWIRNKDKSKQRQIRITESIPEGWERGSNAYSNPKVKEKFELKRKELAIKNNQWLFPIYNEYKQKAVYGKREEVFNKLKIKYNLKGSWQNFLQLCRKYIPGYKK